MTGLKRYQKYLWSTMVFILLLWGGLEACRADWATLVAGVPQGVELLGHMLPPDWGAFAQLVVPALETVQIAFVGTVLGVMLAVFISFFAADNINPHRLIREVTRSILSAERALPDLIVILLFVAIVGLGPFPGVMALSVSSIGMLGKLFADSLEEIDPKPLEALKAVGATKAQVIRYAVLPQVLPSFIANILFRFDVNIRMSVFLGAVGAGGIGFNLIISMRLMAYRETMATIIVILILVIICEKASDFFRQQIIGQEVLK